LNITIFGIIAVSLDVGIASRFQHSGIQALQKVFRQEGHCPLKPKGAHALIVLNYSTVCIVECLFGNHFQSSQDRKITFFVLSQSLLGK